MQRLAEAFLADLRTMSYDASRRLRRADVLAPLNTPSR